MNRFIFKLTPFHQLLIIIFVCGLGAQNTPPEISNISPVVDIQNDVVIINYDLLDTEGDPMSVTLKISNDDGQTYVFPADLLEGDVGYPVLSGNQKQILWYYPPSAIDSSNIFRAKIVADDLFEIDIAELVEAVDPSNLISDLIFLEGVRHRFTGFDHLEETKDFIENSFIQNNLQVNRHEFMLGGYEAANIIGQLPGQTEEEVIFIIDGHFDTVANSPGADDNGSAVAGMLEAMRVLAAYNYKHTITFIGFDLEEPSPYMVGSSQYVSEAIPDGGQIDGVFNFEMIGYYSDEPGSQGVPYGFDLLCPEAYEEIEAQDFRGNFIANFANENSSFLMAQFDSCAAVSVPELRVISCAVPGNGEIAPDFRRSDHTPFWDAGYKAVFFTDTGNFRNPYYHTSVDLMGTLDFSFASNVVKATVATVATLAEVIHCGVAVSDPFVFLISLPGDINQDGLLDVLDIVIVVGCILGEPLENCELGDVNEDGNIDVIDIVQIVNIILEN
ncbi:MAG: M28 family peptidase [Candidatus Marinimicrobia bacterium]|nr:M28 family peptidase [Candidatus Neomarinimicrobiota bacterium]